MSFFIFSDFRCFLYFLKIPYVLSFYSYLIIGIDYDSFEEKGGEDSFNSAWKILNNSQDLKNDIIEIISEASIAIMEIYSKSDLGINNIIPNINFENSWKQIEEYNPNKNLFLKAPKQFSYFMNKGLILRDRSNFPIKKTNKSLCFELDSSQELMKDVC